MRDSLARIAIRVSWLFFLKTPLWPLVRSCASAPRVNIVNVGKAVSLAHWNLLCLLKFTGNSLKGIQAICILVVVAQTPRTLHQQVLPSALLQSSQSRADPVCTRHPRTYRVSSYALCLRSMAWNYLYAPVICGQLLSVHEYFLFLKCNYLSEK